MEKVILFHITSENSTIIEVDKEIDSNIISTRIVMNLVVLIH